MTAGDSPPAGAELPDERPGALVCPTCQRGYAPGRFAGGRTLRCACGALVGRRLVTGAGAGWGDRRFIADSMLGGLARWLRTLGYDTVWEAAIDDAALVLRGVEERRWILTRDRGLAEGWWVDSLMLLSNDDPLAQLAEVHRSLGLGTRGVFTRCTRCNAPLQPAPTGRRAGLPESVREGEVRECPVCFRLYWRGSHTRRMLETLHRVIAAGDTPEQGAL